MTQLHDYIGQNLTRPFVWGQHDCAHFGAGWVSQVKQRDILADVPPWATARQALRIIRAAGGMAQCVDQLLPRIPVSQAVDGDVALYRGAVCLFNGANIVGPAKHGLEFVRRSLAECAWSVR